MKVKYDAAQVHLNFFYEVFPIHTFDYHEGVSIYPDASVTVTGLIGWCFSKHFKSQRFVRNTFAGHEL